jgi:hypothetical protein
MADSIGHWVHALSESPLTLPILSLALTFGKTLRIRDYGCLFIVPDLIDQRKASRGVFVPALTRYELEQI